MSTVARTFTLPSRPLTWLITGCSSEKGMGYSLAQTILQSGKGHKVIATSRTPSKTPSLIKEFESSGHGKWLELDITKPSSIQNAVNKITDWGLKVDVLVNNAGYAVLQPLELTKDEDIRGMMETSYFGPINLIKAFLPFMREDKYGVIVNISSGASLDANESMGGYAAAKAALDGATRVLAKEVAPFNIRALTVIIGTTNTTFNSSEKFDPSTLGPYSYQESTVEQFIKFLASGKLVPISDKDLAMNVLYELITAAKGGRGQGKESESMCLLGRDMVVRAEGVRAKMEHAVEVYGEIAKSISP